MSPLLSHTQCVLPAFPWGFTNSSHSRSSLARTQKIDPDFQLVSLSFFALLSLVLATGSSCCSQWEMRQDIKLLMSALLAASVSYLSNSTSILHQDCGSAMLIPVKIFRSCERGAQIIPGLTRRRGMSCYRTDQWCTSSHFQSPPAKDVNTTKAIPGVLFLFFFCFPFLIGFVGTCHCIT